MVEGGGTWPVRASVQKVTRALATGTSNAERLHLDPDEIHAYLSRTVLGPERLEDVVPDEPAFTRLPVVVAGEALAVRLQRDLSWASTVPVRGRRGESLHPGRVSPVPSPTSATVLKRKPDR